MQIYLIRIWGESINEKNGLYTISVLWTSKWNENQFNP